MRDKPLVLLVEDSQTLSTLYQEYLIKEPLDIRSVEDGQSAKDLIPELLPDLILLDLKLPDIPGEEILEWIKSNGFAAGVIVITAHGSVDVAVEVMRLGAMDFLEKPFDANRLKTTVKNALSKTRLLHIVDDLQTQYDRKTYHGFIGNSLPMQAAYRIIDSAASSKATVFITGESGTGKEVCAEAIHSQSPRAEKPFIALNCGAIPRELMESEIFGHTKGAFTGAASDRQGAASLADSGTLFLDEIGEMDMDLQTKLLRFVQTGTFQKVGSGKTETVDIRFVCATNKDPLSEVKAGRFREDLYYRLHVIPLHLPPLRDRDADVISIARHFLEQYSKEESKSFAGFSALVEEIFLQYDWPGNVRQLQNAIRNIVVLNDSETVLPEHLPPPIDATSMQSFPSSVVDKSVNESSEVIIADPVMKTLAEVEKDAIENAITACDGNIPRAAALLDVSPSTIYRKRQGWIDLIS